jgi:hypothetical protein
MEQIGNGKDERGSDDYQGEDGEEKPILKKQGTLSSLETHAFKQTAHLQLVRIICISRSESSMNPTKNKR